MKDYNLIDPNYSDVCPGGYDEYRDLEITNRNQLV